MFKPSKTALICASALTVLAASAPAALANDSLEIRNFIGTINWSNGAISAEIEKNAGETKITGRKSVVVDGGQADIDGSDCESSYGKFKINWFGKKEQGGFGGYKNLEDLPVLNISVPADTKLTLHDSIVFTAGTPDLAEADVALRHCGQLSLGDIDGLLALDNRGSADVSVGSTRQLVAHLKGSGDLTGKNSGEVLIESRGSADVDLGDLNSLEASAAGSGDISAGNIGGDTELSSQGSGDMDFAAVTGSLSYKGSGSGDLEVSSVTGDRVMAVSRGSGDVEIGGGRVGEFSADTRGSGDVNFSGEAGAADVSTYGSGDIRVGRVTGNLEKKSRGSGDVRVGSRG